MHERAQSGAADRFRSSGERPEDKGYDFASGSGRRKASDRFCGHCKPDEIRSCLRLGKTPRRNQRDGPRTYRQDRGASIEPPKWSSCRATDSSRPSAGFCIEAQRFGKPVIGSDVGNVPNLLVHPASFFPTSSTSGWQNSADCFSDTEYYAMRQASALENSMQVQPYRSAQGHRGGRTGGGRFLPAGYRFRHWAT